MGTSKKHLERLLNTNFNEKDKKIAATIAYENVGQEAEIKAQNDVTSYLKRVKDYRGENLKDSRELIF